MADQEVSIAVPLSIRTWVLVANRAHAQVFESEGGVKNLKSLERIEFPEGRLKNREIDTDRASGGASTAGPNYPTHGMVNKGEAHAHKAEVFAKQLARILEKGRVENRFERLVLVAEDRFLGELHTNLDSHTKDKVVSSVHKDLANLGTHALMSRLEDILQYPTGLH